jgi:hypothetical protein
MAMEKRDEIRDFFYSRRARIWPEQVGIATGGNRHLPGLRRQEVAKLAGISAEYCSRIERGNLGGVPNAYSRRWPSRSG